MQPAAAATTYVAHYKHKILKSMHSASFEPAFPAAKRPHTLRLSHKVRVGKMRRNGRR